jgi:hypothetical protein
MTMYGVFIEETVMKGSLILERVANPILREKWVAYLEESRTALIRLQNILMNEDEKAFKANYIDAVLQFAEARDNERNFFWDKFVEQRMQHQR